MKKSSKIYLAGHDGLVGSAVMRKLTSMGYENIVTRHYTKLNLTRQEEVEHFFKTEKPEYVFICAAKVGGIGANSTYPAEFLYDNLAIEMNIIHTAYTFGVKKLLNMGSSCIYPRMASQPMKEEYLLTGPLEETNEAYALAKIAGIRLCKHYNDQNGTNYISVMPTNQYGVGDNYHPKNSHVFPALIRKIYEAVQNNTTVTLWGDGSPFREFMCSDDLADASIYLMNNCDYQDIGEFVNIGTGKEITIKQLAEMIAEIVGYTGNIIWDTTKPNGTPRKLLDVSRLKNLGWEAKISLKEGIKLVLKDYIVRYSDVMNATPASPTVK